MCAGQPKRKKKQQNLRKITETSTNLSRQELIFLLKRLSDGFCYVFFSSFLHVVSLSVRSVFIDDHQIVFGVLNCVYTLSSFFIVRSRHTVNELVWLKDITQRTKKKRNQ